MNQECATGARRSHIGLRLTAPRTLVQQGCGHIRGSNLSPFLFLPGRAEVEGSEPAFLVVVRSPFLGYDLGLEQVSVGLEIQAFIAQASVDALRKTFCHGELGSMRGDSICFRAR